MHEEICYSSRTLQITQPPPPPPLKSQMVRPLAIIHRTEKDNGCTILPQYLGNLTEPLAHIEAIFW